jgi:hypothetical protein
LYAKAFMGDIFEFWQEKVEANVAMARNLSSNDRNAHEAMNSEAMRQEGAEARRFGGAAARGSAQKAILHENGGDLCGLVPPVRPLAWKAPPAGDGGGGGGVFFDPSGGEQGVAASTQNQALNALVFLYKEALGMEISGIDAQRAKRTRRLPTVLTQGEVAALLKQVSGEAGLVCQLLYGCGLRIAETLSLRVKDVHIEAGDGMRNIQHPTSNMEH